MKFYAFTILVSFVSVSHALPVFTAEELHRHQSQSKQIVDRASSCLDAVYKEHVEFHRQWGVSKFYGDRRSDYATRDGRLAALRSYRVPTRLIDDLEGISCIGLTLRCLGEGFAEVGSQDTWRKIIDFLKIDNKVYGTDLQKMLRQLGWRSLYWNPSPSKNVAWDNEDQRLTPLAPEKRWMPVWGGHAVRYREVTEKGSYYGIAIDDATTLVGFRDKPPVSFKAVPFFVGIAHSGYHVFPGRRGDVIEAHSMRNLNSIDNLEFSPFNPLGTGGGPRWTRSERYRSGVIVVPPGF